MSRTASPYSAIDNADTIIETVDNRECFYLQKIAWFDNTLKWKHRVMTRSYVRRHVTSNGWLSAASFADSSFRRSNIDWVYLTRYYIADLAEYRSNR